MHYFTDGKLKEGGQTLIEAAFLLPVIFFAFGLLLQPALLLYCRCVMDSAAAETCRLAATATCGEQSVKAFALRRLAALPGIDIFHTQECEWDICIDDSEESGHATVTINGHIRLLPLVGITASTFTQNAGDGCGVMSAVASTSMLPAWLGDSDVNADEWVSRSWD